ncbi:sensor domain-containing diguanylate cyclase [Paenibacillus tengchongensis]|uniref:sensor domain-containing diguanylate cyclase n=1 Tax=Paenibacillus tengchongensis TaxID=2608684 RepID=UPI00124F4880|nr:sensor domain-containing diguanylate cyclase [Paenibacillus tengchongensis]
MDERLDYAPCGYISLTREGIITDVNQTFLDMMGFSRTALLQLHIESIMSKANRLVFHSYFYPHINLSGHVEELFISLKSSEGYSIPFILNGRRSKRDDAGTIDCVMVQMNKRVDYELELRGAKTRLEEAYLEQEQALGRLQQLHAEIEQKQTELLALNAILLELSTTDKLTGLRNRRFLQEKLEETLQGCGAAAEPFSLLIVDIDHFKRVNDTFGHPAGDQVLESLASLLRAHCRVQDTVARYGGEEFVLILPGLNAAEAKLAAENLRLTVAQADWEPVDITVSIGIATFAGNDSPDSLLKKADDALYRSKENGRNRVTHHSDGRPEPPPELDAYII